MLVDEADLSYFARIRNAALEGFASRGVEATSIRDVAARAGVSAGMVQHLFKNKAGLRGAVNDHVVRVVADGFQDYGIGTAPGALMDEMGERITMIVRHHHLALRYVARSVADGDPEGLELFDSLVAIAASVMHELEDAGVLREGLDRTWAALHAVVLNLSTVLMESAITRHLPAELREEEQLARWDQASRSLFRVGIFGHTTTAERCGRVPGFRLGVRNTVARGMELGRPGWGCGLVHRRCVLERPGAAPAPRRSLGGARLRTQHLRVLSRPSHRADGAPRPVRRGAASTCAVSTHRHDARAVQALRPHRSEGQDPGCRRLDLPARSTRCVRHLLRQCRDGPATRGDAAGWVKGGTSDGLGPTPPSASSPHSCPSHRAMTPKPDVRRAGSIVHRARIATLRVPWRPGPVRDHQGPVVISATKLVLDSRRDRVPAMLAGLRLRQGWYAMPGAIGLSLWADVHASGSISVWMDEDSLQGFVALPAHVEIMRAYRGRGRVGSATWTEEHFDLEQAYASALRPN